jgi:hypothetical protein
MGYNRVVNMMKKLSVLYVAIIFSMVFGACKTLNIKSDKEIKDITIELKNLKKYNQLIMDKNESEITLNDLLTIYEKINIDKIFWELIITVCNESRYDKRQYDSVKNPFGFMAKVVEQDYYMEIIYTDDSKDIILIWNNGNNIKINNYWYILDQNENLNKFYKILENYKIKIE